VHDEARGVFASLEFGDVVIGEFEAIRGNGRRAPFGNPGTAWPVGDKGSGSISCLASGGMLFGHL
jgi:hypothetical protein